MSVSGFLTSLMETGRVRLASAQPPTPSSLAAAMPALERFDAIARAESAYHPPRLNDEAAMWGAAMLYQAAQCLVYREIERDEVERRLGVPFEGPVDPEVAYSVDLTLRYLPDVLALSAGVSPQDPLVEALYRLARDWPLSSVGVPRLGADLDVAGFVDDPALRMLYVDRVIARGDVSRLADPRVRSAVSAVAGMYPRLLPEAVRAAIEGEPAGSRISLTARGSDSASSDVAAHPRQAPSLG